ncbi:c-type heme family protein [Desulforhopalus sp. 52FAK]
MSTSEDEKREDGARYVRLQTKFLLGLAAILISFSAFASATIYYLQKKALEEEAYQKSELVMTAMAANRSYVRKVLRPKMYEILGHDHFILEAMSSSYISRNVMEQFNDTIDNFTYRRVAINSRNPDYEADPKEVEMIEFFDDNPSVDEWKGIVEEGGGRRFVRYKPVYWEESCNHCHGDPQSAPVEIVERYGDIRGFYREAGRVYGVVSIGLPIDLNLAKIKEIAITVFATVFPSILFLYAIISIFFNRLIAQNLNNVLNIFRTSLGEGEQKVKGSHTGAVDEIYEMTTVARQMAADLQVNRQKLEDYAAKILHSKELLQSVFDGITDPVVLLDRKGMIKNVNLAFLDRYSFSLQDVLHKTIFTLHFSDACPIVECQDIFANFPEKPITREKVLVSGEIFLIYFYPIQDEYQKTESMVCYVKDITEQKKLESKIQQTEKIVSMGQLAAGVAHEINNPLGIILCHTELIKDEPNLSKEVREDLAVIEKHADNCKTIVASLLNFARQHKSVRELVSLNTIIREVVQIAANQFQQQNITIDLDLTAGLPLVNVDVDKLKQVFFNLIINSGQAIDENGYVLISTSYLNDVDSIQIVVEDNGCGIASEMTDKIFDPFFTTKDPGKGTGLGLSVSYGIINDHNGEIIFESVEEKGTRVAVILPVAEEREDE